METLLWFVVFWKKIKNWKLALNLRVALYETYFLDFESTLIHLYCPKPYQLRSTLTEGSSVTSKSASPWKRLTAWKSRLELKSICLDSTMKTIRLFELKF